MPLAALAGWTLWSAAWSDATARALIEFDRVLLFGLCLALFTTVARTERRMAWALRGIAVAFLGLCLCGLVSRTLPELWPVEANLMPRRLSFPLSYWNSLGLIAGLAIVLCLHEASSPRGPRVARVLGAMAIPPLSATLVLTFSRAGIGVTVIGLVVYAVVARPRLLPGVLLACAPATAVTVLATLGADALAEADLTSAAAIEQGRGLAILVASCAAVAGGLRLALLGADGPLTRLRVGRRIRWATAGLMAVALVGGVAVAVASGAEEVLRDRVDEFFDDGAANRFGAPTRSRLTGASSARRVELWEASLDDFSEDRLRGTGAGTYSLRIAARRREPTEARPLTAVVDGHSLYLEVLGELGWPGLAMVLATLGAILARLAWLARGEARAVHAAGLAAGVAWAVHAGVDWDWEMPVTGLWLFAIGGLALARAPGPPRRTALRTRGLLAVGVALVAILPAQMALSQRALDAAVAAMVADDCPTAMREARAATAALGSRPEPFEVLGVCQARLGVAGEAVRTYDRAIALDPRNWELHYGSALVRAAAGRDPRPALRTARRLNPYEPVVLLMTRRFRTNDPAVWRRRALAAPLPGLATVR